MKYLILILAALTLISARPLPTPPVLPVARIVLAPRAQPPVATPGVVISGDVIGRTPGGQSAPIGSYVAYGATRAEALQNAEALEQQVRAEATARAAP
jgi:hypothetical protein